MGSLKKGIEANHGIEYLVKIGGFYNPETGEERKPIREWRGTSQLLRGASPQLLGPAQSKQ